MTASIIKTPVRFVVTRSICAAAAGLAAALAVVVPGEAQSRRTGPAATTDPLFRLIAAGKADEAIARAIRSAKAEPAIPLHLRRLAQARLVKALQLLDSVQEIQVHLEFDRLMRIVEFNLRDPEKGLEEFRIEPEYRERHLQIAKEKAKEYNTPGLLAALRAHHDQLRESTRTCATDVAAAFKAMDAARSDLQRAVALGDNTLERGLSQCWSDGIRLIGITLIGEMRRVFDEAAKRYPEEDRRVLRDVLDRAQRGISAEADDTLGELRRGVQEFVARYPRDPVALAGAADVLSLVGRLPGQTDPLGAHIMAVLNTRYLAGPLAQTPERSAEARRVARELFLQARDAESVDAATAPAAAALHYYRRAYDVAGAIVPRYLAIRVALLSMAFDRTECVARLKRARETQPENAAVLLEEARLAALVDDGPKEAMELVRDAVRKRVYERSYFVGIPEILRGPISRSAVVRRRTEKAWPDSSWLFTTLQDSERLQSSPRGQIELRLLQLQLGDLLCRAPDYWDQAVGIHQKTLVLRRLASMVDALPAEQRALLRIQAEDHARLYADYPTRLTSMVLNREGITVSEYPQTQVERPGSLRGIHISPPGMVSW